MPLRTRGLPAVLLLPSALALGVAAPPAEPQDPRIASAVEQARRAAVELTETLRGLLQAELDRGGYEQAVRACSEAAQKLTQEFRLRTEIDIRRVSLRCRNPRNAPDDYEKGRLEQFDRLRGEGKLETEYFEVVSDRGRETLRYMRPLIAAPLCLDCHGSPDRIPEPVRAVVAERYPEDRATGYKAGDVRGAVSVKIPLAPRR